MFRKRKEKTLQKNIYEYAFTPVPSSERKKNYDIFIVLTGYVMALSCLVTGAQLGYSMPFWSAVAASFTGNIILVFIGVTMGVIACRHGWSTSFLSRRAFGKRASAIFSFCIILLSINWIGVNGDTFAHLLISVFPNWPIPVPVTAVLIVVLWASSAMYGWSGLEVLSKIVVPLGFIGLALCMILVSRQTDSFAFISQYTPLKQLSFTAAVAAVTGNFIFGCVSAPDICRFARSRRNVFFAIVPAYALGLFLINICGILIGQAGANSDFSTAVARLGLSAPFLICTIFLLWTTQDNNLYGGSLAVQNLVQDTKIEGNLSHKTVVFLISGLAAAFASLGAQKYLFHIITFISVLIPPVPGIILCEEFFGTKEKKEKKNIHWPALAAWGIGSIAGVLSLNRPYLIAPLNAMAASFLSYMLLSKIPKRLSNLLFKRF